jgi:hypothetical protein
VYAMLGAGCLGQVQGQGVGYGCGWNVGCRLSR